MVSPATTAAMMSAWQVRRPRPGWTPARLNERPLRRARRHRSCWWPCIACGVCRTDLHVIGRPARARTGDSWPRVCGRGSLRYQRCRRGRRWRIRPRRPVGIACCVTLAARTAGAAANLCPQSCHRLGSRRGIRRIHDGSHFLRTICRAVIATVSCAVEAAHEKRTKTRCA